jgi:hypothetical protein
MYPMASRSTDAVSVCQKKEREASLCQDLYFVFFSANFCCIGSSFFYMNARVRRNIWYQYNQHETLVRNYNG